MQLLGTGSRMATLQAGKSWCSRLATVMGLDPKTVRSVKIIVEPNSIVTAQVERTLSEQELTEIEKMLAEIHPVIVEVPH